MNINQNDKPWLQLQMQHIFQIREGRLPFFLLCQTIRARVNRTLNTVSWVTPKTVSEVPLSNILWNSWPGGNHYFQTKVIIIMEYMSVGHDSNVIWASAMGRNIVHYSNSDSLYTLHGGDNATPTASLCTDSQAHSKWVMATTFFLPSLMFFFETCML